MSNSNSVAGQVAVITGGAAGIGKATAELLVREGARVLIADIGEQQGEAFAQQLNESHSSGPQPVARFVKCDVTNHQDLERAINTALKEWGRLDIMFNNAGIAGGTAFDFPLLQTREQWKRIMDINLTAVIEGTQLAIKAMQPTGGGVIINTASMGGLLPMPTGPVYAATKAAVVHFSRSLVHLAGENIRVNAICPTYTVTALVVNQGEDAVEFMRKEAGGLLKASDVAQGVLELITDKTKAGAVMRVTVRAGRDYWPPQRKARL